MSHGALVIDRDALSALDAALIEDSWFSAFRLPDNTDGLRRVEQGGNIYLLSAAASDESGLLVIDLGPEGPLLGMPKRRCAFERILRVAMRHFDRNVALPIQCQAYHDGCLLSIYGQPPARNSRQRIYFDQAPDGSGNVFAYAMTIEPRALSDTVADMAVYRAAIAGYQDAALAEVARTDAVGSYGILLSEPLGFHLAGTASLAEWYERRLSEEQVRFVDKGHDKPIRLRGAAGTGKTQAMAVKCLRDLYLDHDGGGDKRFAFLTHSSALAHDVVRGMFFALDPSERWAELRTADGQNKLWIGTLYELAQEQLGYVKKGLKPLSLDGREGRELQRMMINEEVEVALRDPRLARGLVPACPELGGRMKDAGRRAALIEELMNEFACVLDAENIKRGTPDADRYVRGAREPWQMSLETVDERQLVIELHDLYRSALKREKLLSMDQMVADFDRYLSTHEWSQLRERDGFDVVFVDEYHYFTRVEAMTLHNLFKTRAECEGRLPLIMAYDLKQSTNDAALGGGLERFRNPGVGESVPVDLKQVFRSTPQIAAFLQALDGSFPALDLEGEFQLHSGFSGNDDGPFPTYRVFETDTKLIDDIFREAVQRARAVEGGGSQVAVLCLNDQLFDTYRKASRISSMYVAITTREDLRELRYARTRCVFSMPEYVAGLQFDTVFLIHADTADLADDYVSQGARRRYVSRLYLGASRAAHRLKIASSEQRGGISNVLAAPIANCTLVRA
ncbi:MAG TPA: UvrD-helicase domain-containing protein [Sphingomonas sp.]|jgi:hypothetical protein|uniref:UvrD-helicase domain-containing protein n=1 Tax=Sphingomonas sp. TaxID=28214 RepID=UPI002EDA6077